MEFFTTAGYADQMNGITEEVNTGGSRQHIIFDWYIAIILLAYLVIVVAVPGNILTLISYYKFESLKTSTNFLIANQSLTDALLGFAAQSFIWANYTQWGLNISSTYKYACLITLACINASLIASILNIFSLTIERLCAVLFPLRYYQWMTEAVTKKMVIAIWAYVALFTLPPLLGWNTWIPGRKCMSILALDTYYFIFLFILPSACALALCVIGNTIIAVVAFKKSKVEPANIQPVGVLSVSSQIQPSDVDATTGPPDNAVKSYKITKMLLTVVGIFCLCLLPWIIITLILFKPPEGWKVRGPPEYILILHELSKVMLLVNTAANPFIYAWRNAQYRKAFQRLLRFKHNNEHI